MTTTRFALLLCVALAGCASPAPVTRPAVEWPVLEPSTFEPTPELDEGPWRRDRLLGDWYHC